MPFRKHAVKRRRYLLTALKSVDDIAYVLLYWIVILKSSRVTLSCLINLKINIDSLAACVSASNSAFIIKIVTVSLMLLVSTLCNSPSKELHNIGSSAFYFYPS